MKITELRALVLKKSNGLQKPKYVVLGNSDYSELKAELEDLQHFLGGKDVVSGWTLGGMNILAESEVLDLRPASSITQTFTLNLIPCDHANQNVSSTGVAVCGICGQTL